jgi:Uma2 family endonuclease
MASTPTRIMSVEEFRHLPKPVGDFDYELHHGELVPVTRPKKKHHVAQHRLLDLLKQLLGRQGHVGIEVAFRAVPENDLRVADVAFVSGDRWRAADPEDNLQGAPDLVIEVLSPPNTALEMYDREQFCLEHGSKEFWTVDLGRRQVRVASNDHPVKSYREGSEIPLLAFGGTGLRVSDIFSED